MIIYLGLSSLLEIIFVETTVLITAQAGALVAHMTFLHVTNLSIMLEDAWRQAGFIHRLRSICCPKI